MYNIKINTDASMKYLRQKYNEYNNWAAALGYYHTGHKCIDSYARELLK
ncbi:MAG: transglycosylase SLT domain-containing protein [Ignavibacteriaceae bacterium]